MEEDREENPEDDEQPETPEAKHHEPKQYSQPKKSILEKIPKHNWAITTYIFAILAIFLLISSFTGGVTGRAISEDKAGETLVTYFNSVTGGGVELIKVEDIGNLYKVTVSYEDQEIPVYITKDGDYLVSGAVSLSELEEQTDTDSSDAQPQEIPKSNKPVVELYVFTYCPYGTQAEKGMIPAAELLGDNIEFKIRQVGAMHGEYEKIEAERQLCIEKNYPNKFLDYILEFALDAEIGACGSNAQCSEPLVNALFTKLGIDKAKINSCMEKEGEDLFSAEEANAQGNGVGGSPTLIINGVEVQSARSPAAYLETICSAFNNAPSECEEVLDSASPSAGFGSSTASSASTSSCG